MSFLRNLFNRRASTSGAPAVLPPPIAAARTPTRIPVPAAPPASTIPPEDCVTFPLKAITDLFPPELKLTLRKQPSEHVQVQIPRALILPQLATGAVRITFGQLRAATPEIFFHADVAPAGVKVLLPLDNVLRQMMPSRRDDQRQPSIPVNIPSVFAKAETARPNGVPGRAAKEPWYSQRRPAYEAPPEPAPTAPPAIGKKPFRPLASERPRRESEAGEIGSMPTPSVPPGSFAIPLAAVLAALPEEIRHALNSSDAQTAFFLIPLAEFEAPMRTGKLLFKWGRLREWCNVELSAPVAPDMEIDLPLAAVVPLFMAARGSQDRGKQFEVDSRIPDIFAKSKTSVPVAAPPPPAAPEPAPPAPQPIPVSVAPEASTPAQVVGRIRALSGVGGAFLATADGLLIAGDVPDANENVLAAFAPTVFAQLAKYADMARLGQPESIDINLAGTTIHVRKSGKLYLGVLMSGGHPLPLHELTRISTALQPHTS